MQEKAMQKKTKEKLERWREESKLLKIPVLEELHSSGVSDSLTLGKKVIQAQHLVIASYTSSPWLNRMTADNTRQAQQHLPGGSLWSLTDNKWTGEVLSFPARPETPLPKTEALGG